jgi:hypothetical protein
MPATTEKPRHCAAETPINAPSSAQQIINIQVPLHGMTVQVRIPAHHERRFRSNVNTDSVGW